MREWKTFGEEKPTVKGCVITVKNGSTRWNVKYNPATHDKSTSLMWSESERKSIKDPDHEITHDQLLSLSDMGYLGLRMRIIRKTFLNKTQFQMQADLNAFYKDPKLFNQPRLYQIESLSSMGTKTLLYMKYLCSLGYNSQWMLTYENKEIPPRSKLGKDIEPKKSGDLIREVNTIKRFTTLLKINIDEFNQKIDKRILDL